MIDVTGVLIRWDRMGMGGEVRWRDGMGREGESREGEGREGKGREGKGGEVRWREGMKRGGMGWEGNGWEVEGRDGRWREGMGREVQCNEVDCYGFQAEVVVVVLISFFFQKWRVVSFFLSFFLSLFGLWKQHVFARSRSCGPEEGGGGFGFPVS